MSAIRFVFAILMITNHLFAQDANPTLDEQKLQQRLPLELWYNLDVDGQPAGYMMTRIAPATYAGQAVYQHDQNVAFQMTQDDVTLDVYQHTTLYYSGRAPYPLVRYENEERIEGLGQILQQSKQVYACQDGTCQLTINQAQAKPITPITYTLAEPLGQYLWLAADDRSLGDRLAFKILEEATGETIDVIMEVTGVTADGENGRQMQTRVAMPDVTIESTWDDTPQMISAEMGFLAITLSDEETARAYSSTAQPSEPSKPEEETAEAAGTIELPKLNYAMPPPNYRSYSWTPTPSQPITLPNTPRQTFARPQKPEEPALVLTAWSTGRDGLPVTDAEVEKLRSQPLSGRFDRDELMAQLAEISADSLTGMQIFTATHSPSDIDPSHAVPRLLDLWALANIPARPVVGLRYDLDANKFTPYIFAEFAEDGIWLPVDPAEARANVSPLVIRVGHEQDAMATAQRLAETDIAWIDTEAEALAPPAPNAVGKFGTRLELGESWQLDSTENQARKFVNGTGGIITLEEIPRYLPSEADQRTFFEHFAKANIPPEMVVQYENMMATSDPVRYRRGYCFDDNQTKFCTDKQMISYGSLHYLINTTLVNGDAESTRQLADRAYNSLVVTQEALNIESYETGVKYVHQQKSLQIIYPEHVLLPLEEGEYVLALADPLNLAVFYSFWDTTDRDRNSLKEQVKEALNTQVGPLTEEKSLETTVSGLPALQTTWQIPDHQAQVTSTLLLLPDDQYMEFRYLVTPGGASYQSLFRDIVAGIKITLGPEPEETTEP